MRHRGQCYFCGRPADTQEHVPPRLFFRGFDCDSITVPSCDEHNSAKSGTDQAVRDAMLLTYRSASPATRRRWGLSPEVLLALDIAEPSFDRTKRVAVDTPLVTDVPPAADLPNVGYLPPSADIFTWVKQLTAALVFDAVRVFDSSIDWDSADVFPPNWYPSSQRKPVAWKRAATVLKGRMSIARDIDSQLFRPGWSASPRPYPAAVYRFEICVRSADVVFRHSFYEAHCWYVRCAASENTIASLLSKIGAG